MERPYELCGRPSDVAAVREDFEQFLSDLEARGIEHIELTFGFAWGNYIYSGPVWEGQRLSVPEIRRVVADAETRQLGTLGFDDLYLVIPEFAAERQYCHEADIHMKSEEPSAYTESVKRDWMARGWKVSERTGDTWRDVSA